MTGYMKRSPIALQFVTFIGLFIGFSLVYTVFLLTVFPAMTGYSILTLQDADPKAPNVLAYLKLTQFLYTLVVYFVPAAVFAYLADPKPLSWIGISNKPRPLPIILALGIMVASLPLVGLMSDWNHSWNFSKATMDLEAQADRLTRVLLTMPDTFSLIINLGMIALLPAIAEEFFFRGVIQRLFIQAMPKLPWVAVLITAILFSAIHMEWLDFVPRVLLGFLLGAIYYSTGNLWLSILGHFLNNGAQVVMMYLFEHKMMHDDPMSNEPTAWWAALISLIITGALCLILAKRSTPANFAVEKPLSKDDIDINSIGDDSNI
jgi:uncharacterized protein